MVNSIETVRYPGDVDLLARIEGDADLKRQLQRTEVLRRKSQLRTQMLSHAVRVDGRLTPSLAESLERLSPHLGQDRRVEAYVYAAPDVNAFVAVGSRRLIIAVSSGAVNTLAASELDFVIGHEVGHATYGHLDVGAEAVLDLGQLTQEQSRLLRSWQRAAEISADRAGLTLCGSLEVAGNALFKTLSGLSQARVDPGEFARQWDELADEILDYGARDHWQMSHPFPPLRMKAMQLFWSGGAGCEAEINRLLAMMEDGSAPPGSGDPLLARFHFWGGLYVALADGPANPLEREHLLRLMPPGMSLDQALAESADMASVCLERFSEARQSRQTKLSASELHRIVQGLMAAARVDGPLNQAEQVHLHKLGQTLGLRPEAFDLVIERQANLP